MNYINENIVNGGCEARIGKKRIEDSLTKLQIEIKRLGEMQIISEDLTKSLEKSARCSFERINNLAFGEDDSKLTENVVAKIMLGIWIVYTTTENVVIVKKHMEEFQKQVSNDAENYAFNKRMEVVDKAIVEYLETSDVEEFYNQISDVYVKSNTKVYSANRIAKRKAEIIAKDKRRVLNYLRLPEVFECQSAQNQQVMLDMKKALR